MLYVCLFAIITSHHETTSRIYVCVYEYVRGVKGGGGRGGERNVPANSLRHYDTTTLRHTDQGLYIRLGQMALLLEVAEVAPRQHRIGLLLLLVL